jgi:hypothetical protein
MFTHNTAANPVSHFDAWRAQKSYPLNATVKVLVNVPRWRPSGLGYDFWVKVLGPLTQNGSVPTTVGACIEAGKKAGIKAGMVQSHLKWFFTWGDQCQIDGKQYVPTVTVATPKVAVRKVS